MKQPLEKNFNRTKSIALSGVISALCFVIMYLGCVTEVLDLSAVVLSAMIIIVAVIELGHYYPWAIWLVTGVLCILLLPKKDIALEFVMFGGVYPMLKSYFEKLPQIPSWILKIVFFNAVFTGWFFIARFVFALDVGMEMSIIAYGAANIFFVLSDIVFSLMVSLYITKIRPRLKIGSKRKK